jgi:transcription elongation factor Elf1
MDNTNEIRKDWVKIIDGKFTCPECENTDSPLTNTSDGLVEANLDVIREDLKNFPTKIIYAVCKYCGMEFIFKRVNEDLYLETSSEEK